MEKSACTNKNTTGDPWEPAGGFITLRNDKCGAIRTRTQAQLADADAAMNDLGPGMNVAFKYEGTGNYAIGRVVSKPQVLTSRTRTDTAWLKSGDKVVDVERDVHWRAA